MPRACANQLPNHGSNAQSKLTTATNSGNNEKPYRAVITINPDNRRQQLWPSMEHVMDDAHAAVTSSLDRHRLSELTSTTTRRTCETVARFEAFEMTQQHGRRQQNKRQESIITRSVSPAS